MTDYQNDILDLYDDPDVEVEGEEVTNGRRFIRWRFNRGLEEDLTHQMMGKLRERVNTVFCDGHIYSYQLHNIENGTVIKFYKNSGGHLGVIACLRRRLGWMKRRRNDWPPDKIKRP